MSKAGMDKAELDARADEALAGLAEARRGGDETTALIRGAGGLLAERVRVQVPGLDGDLARVLASAMEFLGHFERGVLAAGEQWEGRTAPLVLLILGFTAGDLAGEEAPNPSANADDPKVALDAHVDQVLAGIAEAGSAVAALAEAADVVGVAVWNAARLADGLRTQFPGRAAETGRALATAVSFLGGFERDQVEHGTPPDLARMLAMSVLSLTAGNLNATGAGQ